MSFVRMPDPHPGRCKNMRHVNHPDGTLETLRCIDYEGTQHVCSFPAPRHVGVPSASYFVNTDAPQPKPWVRPENVSTA